MENRDKVSKLLSQKIDRVAELPPKIRVTTVKTPPPDTPNVEKVTDVTVPYALRPVSTRADCQFCQSQDPSPWDFLDGVYCISLVDRIDRQNYAAEELHRVGLCRKAQHYLSDRAKKQVGDGWGCFVSHQQLAAHALKKGQKCVLVLEDDFVFDDHIPVKEYPQRIQDGLRELPNDFNRLQLGYQPYVSLPYGKTTHRSASAFTHAIVWSEKGLNWMSTMKYRHMYHDFQLAVSMPKSYDLRPMLVFQRILGTDNTSNISEQLFTNPDSMRQSTWTFPVMITLGALILFVFIVFLGLKISPKTNRWKVVLYSMLALMTPISFVLILLAST